MLAGFTFSYGIFQDYYSTHEPFKSSGDIAVVGTCAMVGLASISNCITTDLTYIRVSPTCYSQ